MENIQLTPEVTVERIKKYLEEGKRFDGRKPEDFRDLVIEKGVSKKSEGSVRVKLGKTEVIVGVKATIGEPYPDSPDKGNLMVTAELSPLSSPRFELGPPKINSIELARIIDRGVRESGVIDTSKLVIEEGKKVWTVFVDIYSMNDDGNLLDAAGIGALAALKISKLPKYDEENEKVLYGEPGKDMPLTGVNLIPITVHKIKNKLVVDPNREEEDASGTRLTIGISNGVISSMQKGEVESMTSEEIIKAIEIAEESWKKIFEKIESL